MLTERSCLGSRTFSFSCFQTSYGVWYELGWRTQNPVLCSLRLRGAADLPARGWHLLALQGLGLCRPRPPAASQGHGQHLCERCLISMYTSSHVPEPCGLEAVREPSPACIPSGSWPLPVCSEWRPLSARTVAGDRQSPR